MRRAFMKANTPATLIEKDGVVFHGTKKGLLQVVALSANQILATDFDGKVVLVENAVHQ